MQGELHSAWQIILQHPVITQQQQLVCQLLCVGSTAVHAAAAGQVLCRVQGSSDDCREDDYWQPGGATVALLASATTPQPLTIPQAESFALWSAQHARLLHTPDIGCKPGTPEAASIAAAAAKGLADATAAVANLADRPGLLLQGYRGRWDDNILQHLPAASLTYLSLTDDAGQPSKMGDEYCDLEDFGPHCRSAQALFKRFINLRHLGCLEHVNRNETNVSGILPALRGMTQLTYLDMGLDRGLEQYMHCLPASLRVLRMCAFDEEYRFDLMNEEEGKTYEEYILRWPPAMDLSHSTAVTWLNLSKSESCVVQTGDILPPNTLKLHVGMVNSWEPVLQLSHLRELDAITIGTDVVKSMGTRLKTLEGVRISLAEGGSSEDLTAYAKLPMRVLQNLVVPAAAVPQLSLLTGVTNLYCGVRDATVAPAVTRGRIAQAMVPLQHLVQLTISGPGIENWGLMAWLETARTSVPLATTLAALSALRSLTFTGCALGMQRVWRWLQPQHSHSWS